MSELRVQLFGHFSATFDGVPLTTLRTSRLQSLFAYLLLNRAASHFRYHLAYQFWPDSSESQALANLRNLVHLLRQSLPDFDRFIQSDTQALHWRENAPFTLDVHEFERLLAFTPGGSLDKERLEQAVALYQGDLLPSCYDDWINPERERLHLAFLASLEGLAEITESLRDYSTALEYTRRLLQADPLHASANCQLIRLYSLMDNRPAALKAYKVYASRLEQELGITPDQETRDLYENLKNQRPGSHISVQPVQTIMVGRQTEWRRLQSIWRDATVGNPQAVFVRGEAGIGKTRLVEEFVQWGSRQGINTAIANCYPAEGTLSYTPIVSWLRSLPMPLLDDIWLTELSRLMPEVLHTHPKFAPPLPLTESWQRQRLFEGLGRAILGKHRKLILVIEDIHWCDQDTLEWLHFLLRFDAEAPILIVATERNDEATLPDHPLKLLQVALTNAGKYSEIELKPLNQEESFQLAAQVAKQGTHQVMSPDLAEHIFRETEGNPLFVVEMVRLGQPLQLQRQSPIESVPLSDKVQTILKWRINQLTPPTRELACLAAAIGREFRQDVLQQASGVPDDALVKALNELLQRKIVFEQTSERYDFTHDKLRQVVSTNLSNAHRRLLHRRVAEAYLHLAGDASQSMSAEIASHYEQAGLTQPAIQYYLIASETAAGIFSNGEAVHWLQHAIYLFEAAEEGKKTSGSTAQALAEMLVRLGDILVLTGQPVSAQQAYERALTQAFDQDRVWRSTVYRKISETQVLQFQHDLAYDSLDRAEQALQLADGRGSDEENQEWISIQFGRGQLMYWDNRQEEMGIILDEIHPFVELHGRVDQQLELLSLDYQLGLRRESYRLSKSTVDLAHLRLKLCLADGNAFNICYATFQVGFALLWSNDIVPAQSKLAEALELAEKIGARTIQARCLAYLSIATRKLGLVDALSEQTEQLLELSTALGDLLYQGVAWANKAWLSWKEGNMDRSTEFGRTALNCWHKYPGSYVFYWLALWPLMAIAVTNQRLDEIQIRARELLDPGQQPLLPPLPQLLSAGLQACQEGDVTGALEFFHQALAKAQEVGDL